MIASAAIFAVAAAPASALKWAGNLGWSGTLTFKATGKSASECTFKSQPLTLVGSNPLALWWEGWGPSAACTGGGKGQLWWPQFEISGVTSEAPVIFQDLLWEYHSSPWTGVEWAGTPVEGVTFNNGSKTKKSTFVFHGGNVGLLSAGGWASATGTLSAEAWLE
jgi:hypothetical protein